MSRNRKNEGQDWSQGRPHEEFLELCALSAAGELTEEERRKLDTHVAQCANCRQALREFETTVDVAVPLLSSVLSDAAMPRPDSTRDAVDATLHAVRSPSEVMPIDQRHSERSSGLTLGHRGGNGRAQVNWSYVWTPFAAAVALIVALGIYSFEVGKHRGQEARDQTHSAAGAGLDLLEQQLSDAGHAREVLTAQLSERDRMIAQLKHQLEAQSAVIGKLRNEEIVWAKSTEDRNAERRQAAGVQRDLLAKVDAAQDRLQKTQAELDGLRQQRSHDESLVASFEAQIGDLNAQLREREETIGKQDDLLAHDRDIRELMGARDLYIAEIYDVARDGQTQKPYGRVFYTKGKSLIFYAYDLDQQVGLKTTSTFQAWGRRGPDRERAASLGIFYEDNQAKKRWVVKCDNPKTLGEIDAVFVTVEPKGGSQKPSSKPLLFAYLKLDPNHP